MENANKQNAHRSIADEFVGNDQSVGERLESLLQTNAEIAREKLTFESEREKIEAAMMKNPLSVEQTFAHFGLLLGTFPPAAIFARFFIDSGIVHSEAFWVLGVAAVTILISAAVGYKSGKFIGRTAFTLEKSSWSKMLTRLPFIGIFWGMLAGGAGGTLIFVVGAFFGALIGALVGATALPVFSVFHRLLKRGDKIELKHFLPLAFGITLVISAFFLGL